ncbi:STAS domain-containing protein [Actinomadura montaniterrae]|uniref:STAS domain-containing protein n=1 Tax=Actinomadura montaniterrae TaxID=1803903 RepID=A0A6L3W3D0_9ACTN|nr:STAS domain-containing protein [Actinomadura montaniterrae]KAB2381857.1 STAS domain-containing protein [Actinomadura montaniterrae]
MGLIVESRFQPANSGLAVVTLAGELDVASAAELRGHLAALIGDGADHLILDFSDVGFVDSNGLSVLAGVHRLLRPSREAGPDDRGGRASAGDQARAGGQASASGQGRADGQARADGQTRADGQARAGGQARADGQGRRAGTLAVAAVNQHVRHVLRNTGFTRIIPIYPSVETAIVVHQAGRAGPPEKGGTAPAGAGP